MINKDNTTAFNKLDALHSYLNEQGLEKEAQFMLPLAMLLMGGCQVDSPEDCIGPVGTESYTFKSGDDLSNPEHGRNIVKKMYPVAASNDKMRQLLIDHIVDINEANLEEIQGINFIEDMWQDPDLTKIPVGAVIQIPIPGEPPRGDEDPDLDTVEGRWDAYQSYLAKEHIFEDKKNILEDDERIGQISMRRFPKLERGKAGSPDQREAYMWQEGRKAGLRGNELAQFLGQMKKESNGFEDYRERGSSSYFKNKAYFPYIGRGPMMVTWNYNYNAFGKETGVGDLYLRKPELLEEDEVGAKSAVWWWKHNSGKLGDDFTNTRHITGVVRGSAGTWKERNEYFKEYQKRVNIEKSRLF